MKKVLATFVLALTTAVPAFAHHGGPHHIRPGHHHHRHWHHHHGWVAPLVIGAGVTYLATRPDSIVIREPVVIERDPVVTNCTEWREVQDSNGNVYRERTCYTR